MLERSFDLNIEIILEDWEVHHAIREVIANAIDEQKLTETDEIRIFKDEYAKWHIRDYGRGIKYEHFTQKENDEKLNHPNVIGKFGIGLKDALATFDRRGVGVVIKSRHCDITLGRSTKFGFEDIVTLHAYIKPPSNPSMVGTEFILDNVEDSCVKNAKDLFLIFSDEIVIEDTKYGSVLEKKGDIARIYINGVKVAKEENFLFSYNITSLTKSIRQSLNRERTNVGRSAYAGRVKSILLYCKNEKIANTLIRDLENYSSVQMHDELSWLDVQEHAVKILNALEKVVFVTSFEMLFSRNMVDEAKTQGYRVISIPENLKDKVRGQKDNDGNYIRDLTQFQNEYQDSFKFSFIDPSELHTAERRIFDLTDRIFALIGGRPENVKKVEISETMRKESGGLFETTGAWESFEGRIIIKRNQLTSLEQYIGTLLHMTAHADTDASDVRRIIALQLSKYLGVVGSVAIEQLSECIGGNMKRYYEIIVSSLHRIQEEGGNGSFTVFSFDPYFIQIMALKDEPLYAEAVSNNFLEGDFRLNEDQMNRLETMGWLPPEELQVNYWQDNLSGNNDDERMVIARLVIQTFKEVYYLPEGEELKVEIILE